MIATTHRRRLAMASVFALALGACSSGGASTTTTVPLTETAAATTTTSGPTATTTSGPTTTTTSGPTTTTTSGPTTTTTSTPDDEARLTKDIVYLEMGGHEYLVDVYVPDGGGSWPVVLALHGATVYKNDVRTTVVAQAAAEAGMLVFVPNWVAEWPPLSAMDAEFVRSENPVLPCALSFAQQQAAGYGGDSSRTVVYGMSGGATSGAQFVLGPHADLTSGCRAQIPPMAPVGAVLGDAEFFLHGTWWDRAFEKDLEEMQTIVAETVDPTFWNADLPAHVRLWAAADGSFPRSHDDPWDEDAWFAQRDPDGTIREDLNELGELDDGVITYIDEGRLLATRLRQAGIETTFDIFPGGHTIRDKVPEIVAYLLDTAGAD